MKRVHSTYTYTCEYPACTNTFVYKFDLNWHIKARYQGPMLCTLCATRIKTRYGNMKKHIEQEIKKDTSAMKVSALPVLIANHNLKNIPMPNTDYTFRTSANTVANPSLTNSHGKTMSRTAWGLGSTNALFVGNHLKCTTH